MTWSDAATAASAPGRRAGRAVLTVLAVALAAALLERAPHHLDLGPHLRPELNSPRADRSPGSRSPQPPQARPRSTPTSRSLGATATSTPTPCAGSERSATCAVWSHSSRTPSWRCRSKGRARRSATRLPASTLPAPAPCRSPSSPAGFPARAAARRSPSPRATCGGSDSIRRPPLSGRDGGRDRCAARVPTPTGNIDVRGRWVRAQIVGVVASRSSARSSSRSCEFVGDARHGRRHRSTPPSSPCRRRATPDSSSWPTASIRSATFAPESPGRLFHERAGEPHRDGAPLPARRRDRAGRHRADRTHDRGARHHQRAARCHPRAAPRDRRAEGHRRTRSATSDGCSSSRPVSPGSSADSSGPWSDTSSHASWVRWSTPTCSTRGSEASTSDCHGQSSPAASSEPRSSPSSPARSPPNEPHACPHAKRWATCEPLSPSPPRDRARGLCHGHGLGMLGERAGNAPTGAPWPPLRVRRARQRRDGRQRRAKQDPRRMAAARLPHGLPAPDRVRELRPIGRERVRGVGHSTRSGPRPASHRRDRRPHRGHLPHPRRPELRIRPHEPCDSPPTWRPDIGGPRQRAPRRSRTGGARLPARPSRRFGSVSDRPDRRPCHPDRERRRVQRRDRPRRSQDRRSPRRPARCVPRGTCPRARGPPLGRQHILTNASGHALIARTFERTITRALRSHQ